MLQQQQQWQQLSPLQVNSHLVLLPLFLLIVPPPQSESNHLQPAASIIMDEGSPISNDLTENCFEDVDSYHSGDGDDMLETIFSIQQLNDTLSQISPTLYGKSIINNKMPRAGQQKSLYSTLNHHYK